MSWNNIKNKKLDFSVQNWVFILALLFVGSSCSFLKKSSDKNDISTDKEVNSLFLDGMQDLMLEKKSDAFIKFTKVIKKQPKNAAAHFQLSRLWTDKKDLKNALIEIKLAKKYDPENKWMLEEYANLMFQDGQFLKAAEVYGELAEKEIEKESYLYRQAYAYAQAEKLEESLKILTQLQSLKSEFDESIQLTKAEVYLKLDQSDSAMSILKSLSDYNPSNPAYPSLLSMIYYKDGEKEKALNQLLNFQKKNPDDITIKASILNFYIYENSEDRYEYADDYFLDDAISTEDKLNILSGIHAKMIMDGTLNKEMAYRYLPKIAKADTITGNAKFEYGVFLFATEEPDSALVLLKQAIDLDSSNLAAYGYILNLVFNKDKADELIHYSIKGEKVFPELAVFNYFSSVGYSFKNQFSESAASAERGLEKTSLYDTARIISLNLLLGNAYEKLNKNSKAEKSYLQALEYDPKNPLILNNYSYFLAVNNMNLNRALQMAETALSLQPGQASFLDTYGWILYKKGDYKNAKNYLSKALKLADEGSKMEIYEHLGDVEVQLGNHREALTYWLLSKEYGGDSDELLKKIKKEQQND